MSDRILARIRQAIGEIRGRKLDRSEIGLALNRIEDVLIDERAELIALTDDDLFDFYSRATAAMIPCNPNFDYVSRIIAFMRQLRSDRPLPTAPLIPENVTAACEDGGYTEPFQIQNDGQWWAFPPNGVMPVPLTIGRGNDLRVFIDWEAVSAARNIERSHWVRLPPPHAEIGDRLGQIAASDMSCAVNDFRRYTDHFNKSATWNLQCRGAGSQPRINPPEPQDPPELDSDAIA